jgi:hypothetical protein
MNRNNKKRNMKSVEAPKILKTTSGSSCDLDLLNHQKITSNFSLTVPLHAEKISRAVHLVLVFGRHQV